MRDSGTGQCKLVMADPSGAHVEVDATYPADLVDNPTAGPILREFVRKFFTDYGSSASFGAGNAKLTSKVFTHPPATKSVVFQSDWSFTSMPHPSGQITTFTFDLDQHKQVRLTDLVCPSLDPLKAIPPIARPYVQQTLSGSPFTVEQFEPDRSEGQFADSYQAWALDGGDLVLYMPAERGPGGIPPGYIAPRIPLATLSPILRDKGCSTATTTPAH